MTAGAGRLARIWRHPVKSLGREALDRVALAPGAAMPFDRQWALAHAASAFDPDAPVWVPCGNFLRVTHAHRLAQVEAAWDGRLLTLTHPDAAPLAADPETPAGAAAIAAWAEPLAEGGRPGPYTLARAPR
ncbi:MAG: MOSC N-terminal beta barrel domain-containing protein, partial [Rubrimonas sp.]